MGSFPALSFCFLALLTSVSVRAESTTAASSGSWGTKGRYQGLYEKGNRTSLEGKVLSTEGVVPLPDMEPGIQLRLEGKNGPIDVHVGPRWFVLERDLNFTKGEPIVVVGVTIRLGGKDTVIADEIQQPNRKVILRELTTGVPVWTTPQEKTVPR